MKKVAKVLADYVIYKGMIENDNRDLYEYGFVVALEFGLFAVFSIFMALYLKVPIEGLFFFIIFAPLRFYAGGLHLKKFYSCFILSCLTYSVVLYVVKSIQVPIIISLIGFLLLEIAVYCLYPVEHVNRIIDKDENKYFKTKLLKFLCIDLSIGIICFLRKKDKFLFEIVIIFFVVVLTMIVGKYKDVHNDT